MINSSTCTEIHELFEILGDNYKNKVPKKFWQYIDQNRYKNYDKMAIRNDLWNKKMSKEALTLFSALNLKYLCKNEFEKSVLYEIYNSNKPK